MSRYIDTEWLIKESMPLSFSAQKWVNEVQIMTAPSIDIVRCKECKHCHYEQEDDIYHCYKLFHRFYDTEHYCSYGERRE